MNELFSKNALSFSGGVLCGMLFTLACFKIFGCFKLNATRHIDYDTIPRTCNGTIKLILVVRKDLKMDKGKVAAQCSHAAVLAHELSRQRCPNLLAEWKRNGQPKIVLKVDTEEELMELAIKAREKQLLASIVQDAGRTQVPSGSKTVLAVGPGPESVIHQVTGSDADNSP